MAGNAHTKSEGGKSSHKKWIALALAVLFLFAAGGGLFFALRHYYEKNYPRNFSEVVERYAAEYEVEPAFVFAVIKTESNFRPAAVSQDDACGLMQLLPDTLSWLQNLTPEDDHYVREDLFDPEINIRYGVFFLSMLFEEFETPENVAAAYHAGINGVRRWLENPEISPDGRTLTNIPYADTRQYVERIAKNLRIYRALYYH